MRTSRVSKETAKAIQTPSATHSRRTRSSVAANALQSFAFGNSSAANSSVAPRIKEEANGHQSDNDSASSLSSADTDDIEDLLEPSRKRKRRRTSNDASTSPPAPSQNAARTKPPRKVTVKEEKPKAPSNGKDTKSRRLPARKITKTTQEGTVTEVEPPSNWESIYSIVKDMRARNPTAPVDTMGCAELHCRASSPRDRRFQTLIALMLSSQTKDTVTAVAMQRLHTQLGPPMKQEAASPTTSPIIKEEEDKDDVQGLEKLSGSTLTLENMLEVSPTRLDELIRTVGFHNNKTKYIKSTATILRDEFDSDIPSTPKELMRLPGVGPKMAFLCMSAAWGRHEGIGVDVHVHRITNLWGWHKTTTPEATRIALESWLPKDKWHEINKLLVGLGQTACLPIGRKCGECDLFGTGLCKAEVKGWKPKVKKEAKREKREEDLIDEGKIKIEQ
jgi:endonuclease-3